MSTQSTREYPSTTKAQCPDCNKTLFRGSDLKRHRRTQHPDGTEVKVHCPFDGCQYKTDQRSNLKAHINAIHSTIRHYRCKECNKGFTDPAGRIRHRKRIHGYQPYHTPGYFARRALKEAEKECDKAALSKTPDQQAANVVPGSQNASSSTDSLDNLIANATYHDDFWKLLVDAPCRDASELKVSQDVEISVPVAVAPALDAPKTLHSNYSDLSLPMVGQQSSTTAQSCDETYLFGPQLDIIAQPQSQALAQSWTAYGHTMPGVASDHRPFEATFPASDWQSTYPDMDLSFQSLPAFSFTNAPLSIPNSLNFPTTSTAPSFSRISGNQLVSPNYMTALPTLEPLLEPVPALSWTPSLSSADSTPLSQTDFFTGELTRDFNTWHNFA